MSALDDRVAALEEAVANIIQGRMVLPEMTEAERLRLEPGDALALHVGVEEVDQAQADEIKARIRGLLGLPDLPILVLGRSNSVEVIQPA